MLSTLLDKEGGKIEVFFVRCGIVQTDEGELDLRVPAGGECRIFFDVKALVNVVRIADHRRIQLFVHARLVQGDRRLDEVSCAIQFVLGTLFKNVFRLVHLKVTVEIPAGKLIGTDVRDRFVRPLFQLRILFFGENVRNRFQPLSDVRIPENMRLVRVVADALHGAESARLLEALVHIVDRDFGIELLQIADEPLPDLHLFKIDCLHEKTLLSDFFKEEGAAAVLARRL